MDSAGTNCVHVSPPAPPIARIILDRLLRRRTPTPDRGPAQERPADPARESRLRARHAACRTATTRPGRASGAMIGVGASWRVRRSYRSDSSQPIHDGPLHIFERQPEPPRERRPRPRPTSSSSASDGSINRLSETIVRPLRKAILAGAGAPLARLPLRRNTLADSPPDRTTRAARLSRRLLPAGGYGKETTGETMMRLATTEQILMSPSRRPSSPG